MQEQERSGGRRKRISHRWMSRPLACLARWCVSCARSCSCLHLLQREMFAGDGVLPLSRLTFAHDMLLLPGAHGGGGGQERSARSEERSEEERGPAHEATRSTRELGQGEGSATRQRQWEGRVSQRLVERVVVALARLCCLCARSRACGVVCLHPLARLRCPATCRLCSSLPLFSLPLTACHLGRFWVSRTAPQSSYSRCWERTRAGHTKAPNLFKIQN